LKAVAEMIITPKAALAEPLTTNLTTRHQAMV
jgi:hypothetical protein